VLGPFPKEMSPFKYNRAFDVCLFCKTVHLCMFSLKVFECEWVDTRSRAHACTLMHSRSRTHAHAHTHTRTTTRKHTHAPAHVRTHTNTRAHTNIHRAFAGGVTGISQLRYMDFFAKSLETNAVRRKLIRVKYICLHTIPKIDGEKYFDPVILICSAIASQTWTLAAKDHNKSVSCAWKSRTNPDRIM